MARKKKKMSSREFDRQFVEIGKKYLQTLPETQREKRLRAFERAVLSRTADGIHAKSSENAETQVNPVWARTRSDH